MSRTMRALVIRDVSTGAVVEEVVVEDPGEGEALVRIVASGVCGSDLHVLHGRSNGAVLPAILGHEGAGIVEAVGPGVSRVAPGDRVLIGMTGTGVTTKVHSDGVVLHPFAGSGSLADYVVATEEQLVKVPDEVPLEVAAISACGVMTGTGAVFNISGVEPGMRVLVVGCGGVGLSVVQACRVAGCARIIAVDANPVKESIAKYFGATDFVLASTASLVDAVRLLEPDGVDVAFEVVGRPELVTDAFECTRPGGECVAVAAYPPGSNITVNSWTLFSGRRLLGCPGGGGDRETNITRIFDLYRAGCLDLDAMITERFTFEGVHDAISQTEKGAVARAVVLL